MKRPEIRAELDRLSLRYPFPQSEWKRLTRREWILDYAKPGRRSIGAEIGVFRGHFSECICEVLRPRKLYLVDPWTLIGPTFNWGKLDYTNNDELPTAVARDEAILRCAQFPKVDTVVVEGAFPACKDQIAEPLDWVYLDASHSYQKTLNELFALDALVAPSGTILGDDWQINPTGKHHGVFAAVQEFVRQSDWRIVAAGPAGQWALRRYTEA
ncbi:class I SAM-dependent methyltransferase [Oceanibium sediminis]|uniref:class I SAM-dependent methyltransferase n=1 Tax=Oceanibium sediminis TaxID=2026339 RepID=UPI00130031D6|nr:class I SAM-dependent methyltransferase [Oceanibium sediminis]